MSKFLRTKGLTPLSPGICDRCRVKMSLTLLSSDPNAPGLMVCEGCRDQFDPYRLSARQIENIAVRHPRPDAPLTD